MTDIQQKFLDNFIREKLLLLEQTLRPFSYGECAFMPEVTVLVQDKRNPDIPHAYKIPNVEEFFSTEKGKNALRPMMHSILDSMRYTLQISPFAVVVMSDTFMSEYSAENVEPYKLKEFVQSKPLPRHDKNRIDVALFQVSTADSEKTLPYPYTFENGRCRISLHSNFAKEEKLADGFRGRMTKLFKPAD